MDRELPVKVTLCQSILDPKNMETALLSFCEMGVTDVVPVNSERVLRRFYKGKESESLRRWQSRARVFQRNSLREIAPTVHAPVSFTEAVKLVKDYDVAILCYENEHDPLCTAKALAECKNAKSVVVFIGPENGFAPEEVELAKKSGAHIVTLGNRIIRACNAGVVFMSMLVYALELSGE